MLDFSFSEEQLALKNVLKKFVDNEVKPLAASIDEAERFPSETFSKLAELGLLGITVPKAYQGSDGSILDAAFVMEELARGCASTALSWGAHSILCTHCLWKFGNESQRSKYLPALCTGKKIGAYCLTEPHSGSDAASLKTVAIKRGAEYEITGTKMFITNGPVAQVFLVFARTGESLTAFVIEREFPGVRPGTAFKKLGCRASPTSEVIFDQVRVPQANRLGEEGSGYDLLKLSLDVERAVLTGIALGVAQASLDAVLHYSQERNQFGQPIANFQLVQEMIARMATELDAARLLVYRAAQFASEGRLKSSEASMAKLFAADMVQRATSDAVQIFGGYGYMREFPVERFYRDSKLAAIGAGTSEIQKLIIAKELLKKAK